ncbi:MAG: histidine phosphatase family protein [Desulforhopalus sp.]
MRNRNPSGKRIILIRHGETEWNRLHRFQGRSDLPLNSTGINQARALALALKDETITAIYSSPLERAIKTACHVGRFHPSTPLIKESGFVEMDLGDFEGIEGKRWAVEHTDFRKAWEKSPATLAMPGGESLKDVQQRAVNALKRISEPYESNMTLLICSHNFVIVSLLCFASKTPLDQFREMRQDTAALNIIYQDGTNYLVDKVNDRRHLL